MPRSPLTPFQRSVRRLMVKSQGRITWQELADQLGVTKVTIWVAKRAIMKVHPIPETSRDELTEINNALSWFDDTETSIMGEMEANDHRIAAHSDMPSAVGFLNIKLGLYNQIQQNRTNRNKFMLDIGMLSVVPQEMTVTHKGIDKMDDMAIDAEIIRLDEEILRLSSGSSGSSKA